MHTHEPLASLLEPIRTEMGQLERLVHETLAAAAAPLGPALCRRLEGGKRLRPALVILSGRLLGAPMGPLLSLAAGLDLLHAATLVHDDLLDGASLRRGRETLHTVWPVGATVLAGDYLLGQAISFMAELEQPRVLGVFGALLRTLCAGEIQQTLVSRGRHRDRAACYRNIEAKTASLFAAAVEMAALLAGAPEPQIAALRHYGRELGLAFQIADDVLDLTGDEAQLGKPAGSDLRQGLVTLPILCYLEQAEGETPVHAVLAGQGDEAHLQAALLAIRASGAIAAAMDEARAHARQAQEALAGLPDSDSRRALCGLATYVVERER